MKKILLLLLSFCLVLVLGIGLVGCANKSETVTVTIPAKSAQSVIFYEKEFTASKKAIKVSCEGIDTVEVLLNPQNDTLTGFITQTVTEKSKKIDAKKGEKFKIGIVSQNTTDTDITVMLKLKNIEF